MLVIDAYIVYELLHLLLCQILVIPRQSVDNLLQVAATDDVVFIKV